MLPQYVMHKGPKEAPRHCGVPAGPQAGPATLNCPFICRLPVTGKSTPCVCAQRKRELSLHGPHCLSTRSGASQLDDWSCSREPWGKADPEPLKEAIKARVRETSQEGGMW